MSRSNTANGGNTYYDMVIQVVSTSDTQYVLRAVIYLKSLNVVDSNNNLQVWGQWPGRSGTLGLNGVYNNAPVWFQDITVNRVYGSGVTVGVGSSWSGVEYWGTTLAAADEYYTVPARPIYPPSAPGNPTFSSIAATSVNITWTDATWAGAGVDLYQLQVDDNSDFSSPAFDSTNLTRPHAVTGLTRAKVYYARVRAHNTAGWGAWSGVTSFTTLPLPPSPPLPISPIDNIESDRFRYRWNAPMDNGGATITSYEVQISRVSDFSAIVASTTFNQSGGGSWTPTGLLPGTTHYVRSRAINSAGASAWSSVLSAQTISGVLVRVAGVWRNARVYVMVGGEWRLAQVFKRVDGVWRS